MNDYIKREDAINNLHKAVCECSKPCSECWAKKYCTYYTWIAGIPSADVQPVRHGHWIYKEDMSCNTVVECSECGTWDTDAQPYCHGCGARMDGETEGDC